MAIDDFLTAVADGRRALLEAHGPLAEVEQRDAEDYFAQMMAIALQLVPVDPARPVFFQWMAPDRRYTDNGPDSLYHLAYVDDRHRYRISGRLRDEVYMSLSLCASDSGTPDREVLSYNNVALGVGPGDPFSIDITPNDGGVFFLSRQYVADPAHDRGAIDISVIDGPISDPPSPDEGWRRAARCFSGLLAYGEPPDAPSVGQLTWMSMKPNTLSDPGGLADDERSERGARSQVFVSGPFELSPDEALVMETRLPPCAYASISVWNRFNQTVDSRFHRSVLNHRQMSVGDDGSVRVVVAGRDPGVPNWVDTGGRPRGKIFWRFILAAEPVQPVSTTVVRLDDLG